MILAAIDIGSNAARILVCEVIKNGTEVHFEKLNLLRIPLRLGFDVFTKGSVGAKKKMMLNNTIKTFDQLMKVYDVDHYMACATSAMRDATNGQEIINEIKQETDIEIEIISGQLEAEIIYENHIAEMLNDSTSYLYIDVGGGSTEITLYHNSKVKFQKSYNIGTVRILTDMVNDDVWQRLKIDLKEIAKNHPGIEAIGSGGNINKILSIQRNDSKLNYKEIKQIYNELSPLSIEERMDLYILKKDRADVIVPALLIYYNIMKWANIEDINVPKIGLVDGLIHHLYELVLAD